MPTYLLSEMKEKSPAHKRKLLHNSNSRAKYIIKGKTPIWFKNVNVSSWNPQNYWFGAAVEMGNGKAAMLCYVDHPGDYQIVKANQLKGIRRNKGYASRFDTMTWKISITWADLSSRGEVKSKANLSVKHTTLVKNFYEKGQKVDVLRDLKNVMPKV